MGSWYVNPVYDAKMMQGCAVHKQALCTRVVCSANEFGISMDRNGGELSIYVI